MARLTEINDYLRLQIPIIITAMAVSTAAIIAAGVAVTNALPADDVTGGLIIIDAPHHEIHEGESFFYYHSSSAPTNTGERTLIAFKTPDTADRAHMLYKASASAAAHFHLIEGVAEGAAGGTEVTPRNHDRNSTTESVLLSARINTANRLATYVAADAGNITGGTTLLTESIGATGQGLQTTGGDVRAFGEVILKQNTAYAFAVENLDNNDNIHDIHVTWYEE